MTKQTRPRDRSPPANRHEPVEPEELALVGCGERLRVVHRHPRRQMPELAWAYATWWVRHAMQ
jgi:hypothetical protein